MSRLLGLALALAVRSGCGDRARIRGDAAALAGPAGGQRDQRFPSAPRTRATHEYFAELKRRIEEKWSYPTEASRKGQSGQGELRFVLRKNGALETVEIVHSSGVKILDTYIENAIRLASPFPPIPTSVGEDVLPISINFTYTLQRHPA